ncbi:MAG TPA: M48 family metalloprotease [Caulobacteraceae bacterium]|nr:M48 family metalloprotease [Caulobacteraceae bacterium]
MPVPAAPFDPAAATERYLDSLSPTLRAAGAAFAEQSHWAEVIGGVAVFAVALVVLKLGLLGRLRERVEAEGPRPWAATAACAFVLLTTVAAIRIPLDTAAAFLADRTLLRPPSPILAYLARAVSADSGQVVALTVGVSLLAALARWTPRAWWAIAGGAVAAGMLAMTWVPYALASGPAPLKPLPPGPARDGLMSLVASAGLGAHEIYVVPSPAVDGDVTGVPGLARVTVDQGMLDHAHVPEMKAAIGHLAGHFAHGDELGLGLLLGALWLGGLLAIHLGARPLMRLLRAPAPVGPADPAALPAWLMIAVVWVAAGTVAERAYIRWINVRADQFSLDHAREPDGLAVSLIRGFHDDKVDPGPLEEALFFDHPPLAQRLAHAMAWKAAHAYPSPWRQGRSAAKAPNRGDGGAFAGS